MNKTILFRKKAKEQLRKGVNLLADAVSVTLGPKGRNVIIEDENGHPYVTKDGVSVAKTIHSENKFQNAGIEIVKEVAAKTNNDAGDGTTTATVLAQAIINAGLDLIKEGYDPDILKSELDDLSIELVSRIDALSNSINGNYEKIKEVASISANNDSTIGELIASAVKQIGENGVITVDESNSIHTSIEVVEGMQFDQGFISPYFVTNIDKNECVLENAYIYITTKKLSKVEDVVPIMQLCAKEDRPLFIIAQDITSDALQSLVLNKVHNVVQVCAVKAPGFAEYRNNILEDIAILVNGVVHNEHDYKLGIAEKIIVTKQNFTIINNVQNDRLQARIDYLKAECDALSRNKSSVYDLEKIKERLAKLTGGIAIIHVGAGSEVELREKKDRIEDALHTTRAALQDGVVAGGGSILVHLYNTVSIKTDGEKVLMDSILKPAIQIAKNAGKSEDYILSRLSEYVNGFGYNAKNDIFEDLLENGIIDAAKVVKAALQNAVSVAGTLLTTECMVINNG